MSRIWQGRKVVVCVGTGGVGKTTVAASIAMAAAASGLRTMVMTIDPARRLANAMGIGTAGNVEREIPPDRLAAVGVELKAPLWVMMPDVQRTFDELVSRTAPSEETRQRVLRNRIYQHFSGALAGAHEYAAVEKLYEVYASGDYELIVLDTPPSQNAVDFLDAPSKVLDFLDSEALQWLIKPYVLSGRFSLKLLDLGTSFLLKTLGRLAGAELIREIADFILSFRGMYEGFRERSRRVRALLSSEETAFVLVTATVPTQRLAALQFRDELAAEGLEVRTLVINRMRPKPHGQRARRRFLEHAEQALAPLGADAFAAVHAALDEELRLATIDHDAAEVLARELGGSHTLLLPELPTDVHDLSGLAALQHEILRARAG